MGSLTTERNDPGLIPAAQPLAEAAPRVLFVDLDGTLIGTALLHEAALVLFKQSPRRLLRALLRLAHGRAAFKRAISEAVSPEIRWLPFSCTFPENTEPAATGQGVVSVDFSAPTGERLSRARRGSPR